MKKDFTYDHKSDSYICPNNERLSYSTTDNKGYRLYKSDSPKCENCPLLEKCTSSRKHQKTISAHIWQEYLDECEKTRHSDKWKQLYPRRKQTIERVFGDCKENHCLRYTRIRGLRKNSHQAAIIYSCLNLKKLSLWRSRNTYLYDLMDKTGKTKQEILESCSKA
ncbi:MAG: transposase [Erysipelotrichaceae bacterium]|nr:transposase [Erysipelotrichaceae bacterium]